MFDKDEAIGFSSMFSGRVLNATRRAYAGARCGEPRAGQDRTTTGHFMVQVVARPQ